LFVRHVLRQIGPNPDVFLAFCHKPVMVTVDALTTLRGLTLRSRDASLSGFHAGQGDAAMNQLSLNTAIMSFAFSGMLAPHPRGYEAPRPIPRAQPKKK
jgi:hypothetical protein